MFRGKNTPPTNPTQRYIRSEAQKGQSFVIDITATQSESKVQFESTVEQTQRSPQESKLVIEQLIPIENPTNFLEIPFQKTIVLPIETQKEEVQEKVSSTTYPFNTCDNPLTKPLYIKQNFSLFEKMAREEEERVVNEEQEAEQTFRFPILDITQNINMKNINPSILPTFHGMSIEDPDSFLYEFDILCRSYNYINNAQKLKFFCATLKDVALRWFMGLGEYTIRTWEKMKISFLKKYQDYYKSKESRNDIFKKQQEDESLEEYLKRFMYNYKKSKQRLKTNIVRTIFLKGIQDEYIDILNLMGLGDISKLTFGDIFWRKYS